jgi:hypothetical protein
MGVDAKEVKMLNLLEQLKEAKLLEGMNLSVKDAKSGEKWDYVPMNPSILWDAESCQYIVNIRFVNYHIINGSYHIHGADGVVKTRNFIATLEPKELKPTSVREVLFPSRLVPKKRHPTSHGLEDCRIVLFDHGFGSQKIWFTCVSWEFHGIDGPQICLVSAPVPFPLRSSRTEKKEKVQKKALKKGKVEEIEEEKNPESGDDESDSDSDKPKKIGLVPLSGTSKVELLESSDSSDSDEEVGEVGEALKISDVVPLTSPFGNKCEKNWLPFVNPHVGEGSDVFPELLMLYDSGPKTVVLGLPDDFEDHVGVDSVEDIKPVKPTIVSTKDTPHGLNLRDFRGSASPVKLSGDSSSEKGWLYVVHEVLPVDGPRKYMHRFVQLSDEFKITGFSKPFYFTKIEIEYVAGATLDAKGENLILTVGRMDSEAYITRVPLAKVLAMINPA